MTTKTISITEEVYEKLKARKLPHESFSDAIGRLTATKGDIQECLGLWKDVTEEEIKTMEKAIAAGRQTTSDILQKLYGKTA